MLEPSRAIDPDTDPRLDAALARFPMAPLPTDFVQRTMARIAIEDAPRRVPVGGYGTVATEAVDCGTRAPGVGARGIGTAEAARLSHRRWPLFGLVMPVFCAILVGMAALVVVWSMYHVEPLWAADLELEARLAWQSAQLVVPPAARSLLLFTGGFLAALGLSAMTLLDRPWSAGQRTVLRRA